MHAKAWFTLCLLGLAVASPQEPTSWTSASKTLLPPRPTNSGVCKPHRDHWHCHQPPATAISHTDDDDDSHSHTDDHHHHDHDNLDNHHDTTATASASQSSSSAVTGSAARSLPMGGAMASLLATVLINALIL
ncbi:hypothetical protein CDD82_5208 [Ophiocordyceps australis]|uniref:Hydrophobin n=1 Tax=Ophiocordyceps australis TaxID=1399860 RepID=A0A2C5YX47_9HYPO|nr:hypothetical protein CDD82_5208 [Ophiocordyceps australis]